METIQKKEKYFDVLSQIFLFRGIPPEIIRGAFASGLSECVSFSTLEVIYSRDSYRNSIGVILSGAAKAVKRDCEGGEIVMRNFEPGGVFGAAALFNDSTSYVTEITAIRKTRVFFLSQQLLRRLFAENLTVAENYISYLSGRICYLNRRIDSFTAGTSEQKLVSYLLELAEERQPAKVLMLPCGMSELSARLHIGRASLYRALEDLTASGAILRSGKYITVLDLEKLKAFSNYNI